MQKPTTTHAHTPHVANAYPGPLKVHGPLALLPRKVIAFVSVSFPVDQLGGTGSVHF